MRTPETITVLGLPYRVVTGKEAQAEKIEGARAYVDFERLEIGVAGGLHPLEEPKVARLSKTLFAEHRENPGFARWLLGVDDGR